MNIMNNPHVCLPLVHAHYGGRRVDPFCQCLSVVKLCSYCAKGYAYSPALLEKIDSVSRPQRPPPS